MSVTRRGSILDTMDSLGKWSMIDIYVLMITLIVFRISLTSPNQHPLFSEDSYKMDMLVIPMWGLYANMIAQILSQISSHIIIYYHRKIVSGANDALNAESMTSWEQNSTDNPETNDEMPNSNGDDEVFRAVESKGSLKDHLFAAPGHDEGEMKTRKMSSAFILMFGIIILCLLLLGSGLTSFRLEVFGLAGKLISTGNNSESSIQHHSIFTMIQVIMQEASYLESQYQNVGLTCLSSLLIITSFVIPFLQTVLLLLLWFLVTSEKQKDRMVKAIEILKAWQYMEVYIVASFLAMWQIGDGKC